MGLNGYAYVNGNPVNLTDPSGMIAETPGQWDACYLAQDCSCFDPNTQADLLDLCLRGKIDCQRGVLVGVATPTLPSNPSVTIFFGGSYGETPDEFGEIKGATDQGPEPAKQTPVWVIGTIPVRYPGNVGSVTAKQAHADMVVGYENYDIDAIGYSGGADSAIIFADSFQRTNPGTGKLKGLALLEGTMTGTMRGGLQLQDQWRTILDNLLLAGVNVYVLNDGGNDVGDWYAVKSYTPPAGASGIYRCDSRPDQPHWDGGLTGQLGIGTNNSEEFKNYVFAWLKNPEPGTCG